MDGVPADRRARPTSRRSKALVDQLLASPHFGERWGRHWLDLVRYAETRGHEFDYDIAERLRVSRLRHPGVQRRCAVRPVRHRAHRRRPAARSRGGIPTEGCNESILGTGFWFLGEGMHSPVDIRKDEGDRIDNQIDVFSKTFLGLTVGCARCHDHKFDAISQADYYALAGYLQSSSYRLARFETWEQDRRSAEELAKIDGEASAGDCRRCREED